MTQRSSGLRKEGALDYAIRKGKLGKPSEFGYVSQICEVTEHTRRGPRGLIVPAATRLGNPTGDTLLPDTISELHRLGIGTREIALDGAFNPGPTRQALDDHDLEPSGCSSPGANNPAADEPNDDCSATEPAPKAESVTSNTATTSTDRASKATSRQIWTGWAILAYNADTLAVRSW